MSGITRGLVLAVVFAAGAAYGQATEATRVNVQPAAQEGAKVASGVPKVVFDRLEHNWVETLDTDPVYMEFNFVNEGDGNLEITDVHATCGCTVPIVVNEKGDPLQPQQAGAGPTGEKSNSVGTLKAVYAPGEKGTIKVRFNPQGKRNDQHQRVTVKTNDPETPEVVIQVKGRVIPLVSYEPPIVQFGDVNKGEGMTMFVTVTGRTPDFEVTFATITDGEFFDVKVIETRDAEVDGQTLRQSELEVTIKPNAPIGQLSPNMTIRTSDARKPFDSLPVSARVVGDLRANPTTLTLGTIKPEETFEKRVRLSSRVKEPFQIISAEQKSNFPAPGKLDVSVNEVSEGEFDIVVKGTAPAKAIALRGTLHIKTNVKGEEKLEIPFFGNVRPAGAAAVRQPAKPSGQPPAPPAQGPQPVTGNPK